MTKMKMMKRSEYPRANQRRAAVTKPSEDGEKGK